MRRLRRFGSLILCLIATSVSAQSRDITLEGMRSEKRVALVIGNSAYVRSPLKNPVNDARAIAAAFRELGFEVLLRENASEKDMKRAVEEFGDRLRGGGVGVFFFAGHGIQVGGRNYLVPVDANIRNERDIEIDAIDVNRVLSRMEDARNRLNIVILDACRDNPFGRGFRSIARGLAAIDAPSGTLIAYSTAPGKLARDGDGANGLYTGELVKAIRESSLRLEDVFKRVRASVRRLTNGEQIPWEASSVEGDFVFNLGRTPTVTRELVREYGTLAIRGKVAGIEVWLDDRQLGATESGTALVISDLATGRYRLKARKPGHKDWEREVHVAADKRTDIVIDIEPVEPSKVAKADDGTNVPKRVDTTQLVAKFGIPLPDDARVSSPKDSAATAARAFLGVWFGVWDGNKLDHILIVESIDGDKVEVIYAVGDSSEWRIRRSFSRVTGRLQDDGRTLTIELPRRPATVIYRINRRAELDAQFRWSQGVSTAVMTKLP